MNIFLLIWVREHRFFIDSPKEAAPWHVLNKSTAAHKFSKLLVMHSELEAKPLSKLLHFLVAKTLDISICPIVPFEFV